MKLNGTRHVSGILGAPHKLGFKVLNAVRIAGKVCCVYILVPAQRLKCQVVFIFVPLVMSTTALKDP